MRTLRTSLAAALLLGLVPALASAQSSQVEQILNLKPSQRGVDYDTPTGKEAVAACKLEMIYDKDKKPVGYAVRDGQGQLVRKVVDANGIKDKQGTVHSDQWSYYKDGFEVYREIDLDDDRNIDECRWMNTGGTRIGQVKGGKIIAWKRLSPEEVGKVLVQALTTSDLALLETIITTPAELAKLGLPKDQVDASAKAAEGRRERLTDLLQTLGASGWDQQTTWYRFDGQMPHVIPADAGAGDLKGDLVLYENAAVFAGPANAQDKVLSVAYLQVPEMIRLGDVWKLIDLPFAVDPKKPTTPPQPPVALRSAIYSHTIGGPGGALSPELDAALKALAEYDGKAAPDAASDPKKVAEFHVGRIEPLKAVAKAATNADEQLTYYKEIVNSLAAAYQSGQYPAGGKALEQIIAQGDKLGTYADYRKILAEYAMEADDSADNRNLLELQKKFLTRLETFLKDHPKADEAPDVLFQLASGNEFNAAEAEARTYYARLAKEHPGSEAGKKAVGALRRLDLVDQPISLAGQGANGEKIDARSFQGKTLLILFWNSEATQFKNDLEAYSALIQKYRDRNFQILGVNLDPDKAAMDAFLKRTGLAWPQIHEPGGMDSRLADEYGILTLPTMFLVDPQGKVLNRSLRTPAEVERHLEKPVASRPTGVTQ